MTRPSHSQAMETQMTTATDAVRCADGATYGEWKDIARTAFAAGYSRLMVTDLLMRNGLRPALALMFVQECA